MDKFGKSQPVTRREDIRFLSGAGQYVDDTAPKGALYAFFLRSPVAHGTITELDFEDAAQMDGVREIITAQTLLDQGVKLAMQGHCVENHDGTTAASPIRPVLAQGRVRYVGEPIAMVIAENLNAAKNAAEAIMVDFDDLPTHIELATGGAQIHEEAPDNIAYDYRVGDAAAADAALKSAAHVIKLNISDNRVIINAMEPRGCWANMENGRLHVCFGGQGVWTLKGHIADHLSLPLDQIKVTNPDVGGGFGLKAMTYPEYICIAQAARMLNAPIRWISERTEGMLSDHGARDLTHQITLGFNADHKIQAYQIDSLSNLGAYNSQYGQGVQSELFAKVFTGNYHIPAAHMRVQGIYTNTTQIDAYRGAGRPEAIYAIERAMDYAAKQMGLCPWALRRKNFITPDQFPYALPCGDAYEYCEFERILNSTEAQSDSAGFAARRSQSAAQGKLRGIGLCTYIESILGSPTENARVVFTPFAVDAYVGTQSNGQGHETVYAQFLSDQTGVPADNIRIIQGDSDLIPQGGGTGGSQSVTIQGTALLKAAENIISAFKTFLALQLDHAGDDISFDDENFRIAGSNQTYSMLDVADMAQAAGRSDLLDHHAQVTFEQKSFPNGAHVTEVEIDPETGQTTVEKYTVVDDFGHLINSMLVQGQIHGGVAQGLGQALMEQAYYDSDGQLLSASFMDYAMPRADDMPHIDFTNVVIPSKRNPLGMKGCGEAGTIGAMAAIANAVQNALDRRIDTPLEMPFTPHRVWQALQN